MSEQIERTWKEFWWRVFSEKGSPSSKRIAGMLCVLVGCAVDIALAIKFGANSVVESITMTLIISGISLLGVSKVADSLAKNRVQSKNEEEI